MYCSVFDCVSSIILLHYYYHPAVLFFLYLCVFVIQQCVCSMSHHQHSEVSQMVAQTLGVFCSFHTSLTSIL